MRKLLLIITLLSLSACQYDKFDDWDMQATQVPSPNITIADLNALASDQQLLQIGANYVITGTVTSHDKSGNFYKSIVIDDGTAGIEIMVGLYDLSNLYPLGSRIVVSTLELYLGIYDGVVQLGMNGYSYVGYMDHKVVANKYITLSETNQNVDIQHTTISQLSDDFCGRLVQIDNLKWSNTGSDTWTSENPVTGSLISTYSLFKDTNQNQVYVYVSAYADFASEMISEDYVNICGILYCGAAGASGSNYYIKIRDLDDVATN